MIETEKSPIIERLIEFIKYSGLSSSQFADKAGIPRPTISQLLHGRNKSLNNQILSKLDEAFPELNLMWLLFGRGDMQNTGNIKISEQQKSSEIGIDIFEDIDEQPIDNVVQSKIDFSISDKSGVIYEENARIESERPVLSGISENTKQETPFSLGQLPLTSSNTPVNESRKISSIIVVYSDGSFETFKP